jgi:hypothetical protein
MRPVALIAVLTLFVAFPAFAAAAPGAEATPVAKKKASPAPKKKAATSAKTTPAAAQAPASDPSDPTWKADWIAKYVISTPKEGYTHVLIDMELVKAKFEGKAAHANAAKEALRLIHSDVLKDQAEDLVKLNVVFLPRARQLRRAPLGQHETRGEAGISRKVLSTATEADFDKDEASWIKRFQKAEFY